VHWAFEQGNISQLFDQPLPPFKYRRLLLLAGRQEQQRQAAHLSVAPGCLA